MRTRFTIALLLGFVCFAARGYAQQANVSDKPSPPATTSADPFADTAAPDATSVASSSPPVAVRAPCASVPAYKLKPAEERIFCMLEKPTTLDFVEQPLTEVIQYLKDLHEIEIQIDSKALEEEGITTDTPITRNLQGITLRSALHLMLKDLDMTSVITDEVLLITTVTQAKEMLYLREYPIGDLLSGDKEGKDKEQLLEIVTSLIRPDSWNKGGGPGDAKIFRKKLLIMHQQAVHQEISDLLTMLRAE
jgi:hypothetical protein